MGLDANATRKATGRWGRGLRWKLVALTGGSMATLGLLGTVVFTWQAREVMRAGALEAGLPLARVDVQILAILKGAFAFGLVAFVACVLVSLLVARMLVTPLERLSVAAAGVARGDLRQDLVVHGHDEVAATSESFRTMADDPARGRRRPQGDLRPRRAGDAADPRDRDAAGGDGAASRPPPSRRRARRSRRSRRRRSRRRSTPTG